MLPMRPSIALVIFLSFAGGKLLQAQQEIGYIEKFALASDRREALKELIPSTKDYFYYHCLHFQNEMQLAEAEAILTAWRTEYGDTGRVQQMLLRQMLLTYEQNPKRTIDYLRNQFGINYNHAAPSKDRAAKLKTSLDNSVFNFEDRLEEILKKEATLAQVEENALPLLLNRKLSPGQLRDLLGRLQRADFPLVVARIADELALKDSKGFGWARVHSLLSLEQLQELQGKRPNLLENSKFVRAYSARLAPREGASLTDRTEMRNYLERLQVWAERLPASQNSFKALVIGNRLRLDLASGVFDQELFLKYLALPRSAPYYNRKLLQNRSRLTKLDFSMNPYVPLPPMGDDSDLVRRYLEHFLKSQDSVDAFAPWLDRDYLDQVLAATKVLYGVGDNRTWYAKLSPTEQRALRERIEIRFAPNNPTHLQSSDEVSLDVELKNVDELIIRIYEINTAAYLRSNSGAIDTNIDLDGLVANEQRILEFTQPAELRHLETLQFPEMRGRGVWVVDLLGGGRRSRALIRKGELIAVERLGDAGHVLQILDETGAHVPNAYVEFGGRKYTSESGEILIPFAEKSRTRQLLLVHEDYASQHVLAHRAENYQLRAGFLLDRQSLVAGNLAKVAINSQLTCNGTPISIHLLESPSLSITATDADGIQSTQVIGSLDLEDGDEFVHEFLVPQRLKSMQFLLNGRIYNQSKDIQQDVSVGYSVDCNGIQASTQIGDFHLQHSDSGFRLLVLGRNGEPMARMPVTFTFKDRFFKRARTAYTLATDTSGTIELGQLEGVENFVVGAQEIRKTQFSPQDFHRDWPSVQFVEVGKLIQFPLGKSEAEVKDFSLYETRNGQVFADVSEFIQIDAGVLGLVGMTEGDYVLRDHEVGQSVSIRVEKGVAFNRYVVGESRVIQRGNRSPVFIRNAVLKNGKLDVEVENSDPVTRLHVIVDSFFPQSPAGRDLQLPSQPLMSRSRNPLESYYIDSLRLDEEYSYILNRKNSKKYPGNLLPQPSLLIHPWEVSTTENERSEAKKGEKFDSMADSAPASPAMEGEPSGREQGQNAGWKSYDFLEDGGQLLANLALENGKVSIPLEDLTGFSSITLVAVHPSSSDSRIVALPATEPVVRDMRLRNAFEASKHLAEAQTVRFLEAGEKLSLGDPRTRRLETYSTLGDVFQLYATMLNNPEWEKFRFVSNWSSLAEEEKEAKYNEMACHELNFFVYMKDRAFFDRVVKPQIRQKLDRQLVDQWLLGESIESYTKLWRTQRLNALERVLLAKHVANAQPGTLRWLSEYVKANPIPMEVLKDRFRFALSRSSLDFDVETETLSLGGTTSGRASGGRASGGVNAFGMAGGGGGLGGGARGRGLAEKPMPEARSMRRLKESSNAPMQQQLEVQENLGDVDFFMSNESSFYKSDRLSRTTLGRRAALFQTLDQTKEWAETQYYRTRLSDQAADLIQPNSFWHEYLKANTDVFVPTKLESPVGNLNEALCALAVIDLPFETEAPILSVENDELFVESPTSALIFLESIEACEQQEEGAVLVGQDIYLAQPNAAEQANRPVQSQPLLVGVSYRANVVVTNPSNELQRVQVLTQLPQGAMPLAGGKVTRSTAVEISPYSTAQVQYQFYFPAAGEYDHYGAQISHEQKHIAHTESTRLRVLAEPESVDEETWTYVADWGTNEAVLTFLEKANLQQLDLARIAFRMADKEFYTVATEKLSNVGSFDPAIWAYSLRHRDEKGIEQLLQNRNDVLARLGTVFHSGLVSVDPSEQMSYEHLDYKPLVVGRVHQLGSKKKILNPSLHRQYHRLLDVIAHEQNVSNDQKLQLCYYFILQNRIDEALDFFAEIDASEMKSQIQYVYLDAYLDFFRGNYERAAELAREYAEYPVPRWKNLFSQIYLQVDERVALLNGQDVSKLVTAEKGDDEGQRLLTDGRLEKQTEESRLAPTLDLSTDEEQIRVDYTNLTELQVNYYQMDIELLFSRKPFVSQNQGASPVIRPNHSETIELANLQGSQVVALPEALRNRNVLVEVVAEGIVRSSVLTANSLKVDVAIPFGQIQVMSEKGRAPVEGAYVKVYAKHRDGSVKFFKDGYTDLRGRFDYATLSTSDLNTTERFAILVLDEERGAIVREAAPPVR